MLVAGDRSEQREGFDRAPVDRDRIECSFCGKRYADVETIVCGPTPAVAICNECVELVTEIMAEQRDSSAPAA